MPCARRRGSGARRGRACSPGRRGRSSARSPGHRRSARVDDNGPVPRLPDGDPAPASGELPDAALATLADTRLGIYVHVPYCSVRCGYCDFNTYTLTELGARVPRPRRSPTRRSRSSTSRWASSASGPAGRHRLRRRGHADAAAGGRPRAVRRRHPAALRARARRRGDDRGQPRLGDGRRPRGARRRRVHPGVDRHAVGRAARAAHARAHPRPRPRRHARSPGRRPPGSRRASTSSTARRGRASTDWRAQPRRRRSRSSPTTSRPTPSSSRRAPGSRRRCVAVRWRCPRATTRPTSTSWPTRCSRGAGFDWYEVSNWSRTEAGRCRHNEGYWRGDAWWGVGPGAHSHVGGVRWWNVKHPSTYAARLGAGASPAAGRETLTASSATTRRCCCGSGCARDCRSSALHDDGRAAVAGLVGDGLVDGRAAVRDRRVVLTRRGRLLADAVVRRLLGV